jgi:hypothetical protein
MAVVDMIPTLDEAALKTLLANARRLEAGGTSAQKKAAEAMIPVIDAELVERESRKPPKKTPVRAKRKTAAAAAPVETAPEAKAESQTDVD